MQALAVASCDPLAIRSSLSPKTATSLQTVYFTIHHRIASHCTGSHLIQFASQACDSSVMIIERCSFRALQAKLTRSGGVFVQLVAIMSDHGIVG